MLYMQWPTVCACVTKTLTLSKKNPLISFSTEPEEEGGGANAKLNLN